MARYSSRPGVALAAGEKDIMKTKTKIKAGDAPGMMIPLTYDLE